MSCVEMLLVAWILSLFGFDEIFCQGIKEIFNMQLTISGYYVVFFLAGLGMDILEFIKIVRL